MLTYWLLLLSAFLSFLGLILSKNTEIRIVLLFFAFCSLVSYLCISRYDDFLSMDMGVYHNQYYDEKLSDWHLKEPLFWFLYRLPNKLITVESYMIAIDFVILFAFYKVFRKFNLSRLNSFSSSLVLFHFFPLELSRQNAYRQYIAEAVGIIFFYAFFLISSKKSNNLIRPSLYLFLPLLFHNGAIIYAFNVLLLDTKKTKYFIGIIVVACFSVVFFLIVGESGVTLASEKITRDRHSSGVIKAEYLYIMMALLLMYFFSIGIKGYVGIKSKIWVLFFLVFFAFILMNTTSTYIERIGMYILAMLFPMLLVYINTKKMNYFYFFMMLVIFFFPLLFPATSIILTGENFWN